MGGYPSLEKPKATVPLTQQQSCMSLCALDTCVLMIFENVSREQAIQSVVNNVMASTTFIGFLSFTLIDKVDEILKKFSKLNSSTISSGRYIAIQHALEVCCNVLEDSEHDMDVDALDQSIFNIICDAFPGYLESKFFYDWRSMERCGATQALLKGNVPETTLPELDYDSITDDIYCMATATFPTTKCNSIDVDLLTNDSHNIQISSVALFEAVVVASEIEASITETRLESVIDKVFDHCDPIEASKILRSRSWLPVFLAMAETLPIGISLSRVKSDNSIFPVIFMNKYLEKLLGYDRKSCIENNWDFLHLTSTLKVPYLNEQSYNIQRIQIKNLDQALLHGKSIVIKLVNQTYNGEYFNNIVGMKPLLDDEYEYRYVLGFHVNLNGIAYSCEQCHAFLEKLIASLPRPELYHDIIETI
eukprot:gene12452-26197_t